MKLLEVVDFKEKRPVETSTTKIVVRHFRRGRERRKGGRREIER